MAASWLSGVIGATLGQCALNLGLLVMSPMMISEVCHYITRPAIAQFTQIVPIVFAVVEVATFPSLVSGLGAGLYFVLSCCCVMLAVLILKKMSRTARVHVDENVRRNSNAGSSMNSTTNGVNNYGAFD